MASAFFCRSGSTLSTEQEPLEAAATPTVSGLQAPFIMYGLQARIEMMTSSNLYNVCDGRFVCLGFKILLIQDWASSPLQRQSEKMGNANPTQQFLFLFLFPTNRVNSYVDSVSLRTVSGKNRGLRDPHEVE